jgi:hypothetical protein
MVLLFKASHCSHCAICFHVSVPAVGYQREMQSNKCFISRVWEEEVESTSDHNTELSTMYWRKSPWSKMKTLTSDRGIPYKWRSWLQGKRGVEILSKSLSLPIYLSLWVCSFLSNSSSFSLDLTLCFSRFPWQQKFRSLVHFVSLIEGSFAETEFAVTLDFVDVSYNFLVWDMRTLDLEESIQGIETITARNRAVRTVQGKAWNFISITTKVWSSAKISICS